MSRIRTIRRRPAPGLGEELTRGWRRFALSASGGFDHSERPPPPERTGRGHRLFVATVVITLAATMIGVLSIPAAALLGRLVGTVSDRLAAVGPNGKVIIPVIAQRSVILGRKGEPIATLAGEENRRIVTLDQIAPIAQEAVIAIEDARFFLHNGVDRSGVLRAFFANASAGRVREGGSTITQQLVKNAIVGNERSLDRKIREAQYAIALERTPGMTKQKILELYLNETYFGNGVYGMEAAAEYYFGVPANALSAVQAAMLAGLISAPERYNPFRNPTGTMERRNAVLNRMAGEHYITQDDFERLRLLPLGASKHPLPPTTEPYFAAFIKKQILEDPRFGATRADRAHALFQGGLRIETTLDIGMQNEARKAIDRVLDAPNDPAASLVSIEPSTGIVRAMVGGKNFNTAQYNLAIGNNRQAGSTFKPFTMVAALNAGILPSFRLDTPSPLHTRDASGNPWDPENYSHHGEGVMDMRKAIANSVNTYFVQLIQKVGPAKVVQTAHDLGIQSHLDPVPSLALGTLGVSPYEMASAYGTLANNGIYCRPYTIRRVVGADNKEIMRNDPQCTRVLDASIAAQADDLLQGVIKDGTGRKNGNIGRPAGGKTGTTDDYTDAWFMGFTPQFSTAVWLGYPESTKRHLHDIHGLKDVFGGSLPAMIWNQFMHFAHYHLPVVAFPPAPDTVTATVPDVVGQSRDAAVQALESAGFKTATRIVASPQPQDTVVAQSPPGRTITQKGALVQIDVSGGPSYSPQPSPS